jgi:hypothetical protein
MYFAPGGPVRSPYETTGANPPGGYGGYGGGYGQPAPAAAGGGVTWTGGQPAKPPAPPAPGGASSAAGGGAGEGVAPGTSATMFGTNPYSSGIPLSNNFVAQTPTSNMSFSGMPYAAGVSQSQSTLNGLQNMLMAQAQGGGPNPAAEQLKQGTNRNIAQAYALGQSQPNNAGAARNIANNVAGINQQSASDAAQQRMQQQLSAQQQLGQISLGQYGTAGRLLTDAEQLQLQQAQGNQQAALNAQAINAQTSIGNQQYGANVVGSGINAGAAALANGAQAASSLFKGGTPSGSMPTMGNGAGLDPGLGANTPGLIDTGGGSSGPGDYGGGGGETGYAAYGGMAPNFRHYADGGAVAPDMAPYLAPNYNPANYTDYSGKSSLDTLRRPDLLHANPALAPYQSINMRGGALSQLGFTSNSDFNVIGGQVAPVVAGTIMGASRAATAGHAAGGAIPGRASKAGNSYSNDTVPAMLSPGEIVLPRSVTQDPAAAEKAKQFVEAIKKRKKS